MAEYYFCNGTTAKNKPCQIHVPEEGNKCHFHSGGDGPNRIEVARAIFKAAKAGIDAICYLHAASDAVPFALELAKSGLKVFGNLIGMTNLSSTELSEFYEKHEMIIVVRLSNETEDNLRNLAAFANHLVSLVEENNRDKEVMYVAGR